MKKHILAWLLVALMGCAPEAKVLDAPIVEQLQQGQSAGTASFEHTAWNALLAAHANPKTGRVDYASLKAKQPELDAYLNTLAGADLTSLGRNEQFALLLNAYNAYTVKLILEHYPNVKSIRDLDNPWKTRRYLVAGHTLSLDDIEHGLLRPLFKDPRIHFAVNCASIGCPPLPNFAFQGAKLDSQLDRVTRNALENPRYAKTNGDQLQLNAIFDWYGKDFTDESFKGHAKTLPVWVARYARPEVKDLVKAKGGSPKIEFMDYDWKLNDLSR